MALRYKISILAVAAVLIVLIPLSLIYIQALARAEEEEIRHRLETSGRIIARVALTSELGAESEALQYMFMRSALETDKDILFAAVYPGGVQGNIAVLNQSRFPNQAKGSEWEVINQFVEEHMDPSVHYVEVRLSQQERKLLMGYSVADIDHRRLRRQIQATGWAIGLTLLATAGSMFFARWLTRPIHNLAKGMSRVAHGDLAVRLARQSSDEIGDLTQDFNRMVADLQENVVERQRMSNELDIARRIQQDLLPQSEPEIPGLDISGICMTYAEVGGDYYDYLPLKDGRLAIVLGDVFGHGLASGLLAAAVQGCLHNQVRIDPKPSEVLAALDEAVHSSGGQLMTLVYTILDPNTGSIVTASAGHWSPSHYQKQTHAVKELYLSTDTAPVLGVFPTEFYPEHQNTLEPGDFLAFYSDGILEASGNDVDMYGEERFHASLRQYANGTAREIRDAILNEVKEFRGDAPQGDDIALVIVKYKPSNGEK